VVHRKKTWCIGRRRGALEEDVVHRKKMWCIGQITSSFIAHMEQILWLYSLPHNPLYPVVCFDERPCFLIGEVIAPLNPQPAQIAREHLCLHQKRLLLLVGRY